MLVTGEVVLTFAMMARVAEPPLMRVPTFQSPPLYEVVPLAVDETRVKPAGSTSVTCTPVAVLGPLLVAVRLKVTLVPKSGTGLSTDLVMAMSADWPVTVAEDVSFAELGSGWLPAVRVAVLVAAEVVFTVATIVRVWLAVLASGPICQ